MLKEEIYLFIISFNFFLNLRLKDLRLIQDIFHFRSNVTFGKNMFFCGQISARTVVPFRKRITVVFVVLLCVPLGREGRGSVPDRDCSLPKLEFHRSVIKGRSATVEELRQTEPTRNCQ